MKHYLSRQRKDSSTNVCFFLKKIPAEGIQNKDHRGKKKKNNLTWNRKHVIHFTVLTSIIKYLSMKNASGTELGAAKYIAHTGYQCASAVCSRMQSEFSRNVPS